MTAAVSFRKSPAISAPCGRRRGRPRNRGRASSSPCSALGLRQDDLPAPDRRLRAADRRAYRDLRRDGRRRAALSAQRQHGVPGLRAVPASERARQCRLRPDGQGRRQGRAAQGGRRGARLVKLPGYGARRPGQLSGGQRQRVALARALVNKPKVLLLDEPLGALDLKLREQMQEELKTLQKSLGITFVFVTHDQGEALSMADRVAVFNDGKIMQVGTPEDIYQRPQTALRRRFRRLVQCAAARFRRALCRAARAGRACGRKRSQSARGRRRRRCRHASSSRSYPRRRPTALARRCRRRSASTSSCPPATPLPAEGETVALAFDRERPASDGRAA